MIKIISRVVITLLVCLTFVAGVSPARASVKSPAINFTCTSITISGHSSNPVAGGNYGIIYIIIQDTEPKTAFTTINVPVNVDANHDFTFSASLSNINNDDAIAVAIGDQDNFSLPGGWSLDNYFLLCEPGGISTILFPDGRINQDPGQTVTAYCQSGGSLNVYDIDPVTSDGSLAFTVTPAEIASVTTKPAVDTVIKSGGGATLYRLSSGELQLNRAEIIGKMYSFIFSACPTS